MEGEIERETSALYSSTHHNGCLGKWRQGRSLPVDVPDKGVETRWASLTDDSTSQYVTLRTTERQREKKDVLTTLRRSRGCRGVRWPSIDPWLFPIDCTLLTPSKDMSSCCPVVVFHLYSRLSAAFDALPHRPDPGCALCCVGDEDNSMVEWLWQ